MSFFKSLLKRVRDAFALAGILLIVGCAPDAFAPLKKQPDKGSSASSEGPGPSSEKMACKFIGPGIIVDRLKNKLGITSGDFPILKADGTENPNVKRVASSLTALGQGNPATGTFDDFSCSAVRFKAGLEVMIDACGLAMKTQAVKTKLFPNGNGDFTQIFKTFTGREPTAAESADLKTLTEQVPADSREAAVCAAVAASFEALIKI